MIVKIIKKNVENKMKKIQESINKDLEKLRNKYAKTNNTITEIKNTLLLSHISRVCSVRPHRRQPTRLPGPWDSPGKNTGVGCHFLLQPALGFSQINWGLASKKEVQVLCKRDDNDKPVNLGLMRKEPRSKAW